MGEHSPKSNATAATVKAKACLACRSKHIKCNGANPCSYCVERQVNCVYVASRRGYFPRQSRFRKPKPVEQVCPSSESPGHSIPTNPSTNPSPAFTSLEGNSAAALELPVELTVATKPPDYALSGTVGRSVDSALDAYYHYCFPAHPFVLTAAYLAQIEAAPAGNILVAAMRWAGSLFIKTSPSKRDGLFAKAYNMATDVSSTRNGYLAQAMLVLVIGMDGVCKRTDASQLLAMLEELALEIGLNRREFAMQHSTGLAILEESWRRTWWELYVVDAMVAGVHRQTSFPLYSTESDVALPCNEDEYLRADIPTPRFLYELQDEAFSTDSQQFSSFAYRILCANIMGQFLQQQPISKHDEDEIRRLEASLTNWQLHLPESKREAIQSNGKPDEMMFQALMMHHAMAIMLHQPLSQLDTTVVDAIDSCASPRHMQTQSESLKYDSHAAHAISSATAISDLVTHRVTMLRHSHFFACVVTLSSIVHFSHWAIRTGFFNQQGSGTNVQNDADIRQSIKLNIGALRSLASVWPAASNACLQIQSVAQELHNMRKKTFPSMQVLDENLDFNLTQALAVDDTLWQMWNSLG